MRKILDWLNASSGYGWLLVGGFIFLGLALWNQHASALELPRDERASYECRIQGEVARSVAQSREDGG